MARRSVAPRRCACHVLAFCRCRVGRSFHRGLHSRALRKGNGNAASRTTRPNSPEAPRELEVPAPTAWPFVLAFGFTLLFAGLVTSMSVSVLGAVLALAGCVGWFREVFPREHEVDCPGGSRRVRAINRAPRRRTGAGRGRSGARLASRPHVSDFGRRERRIGGKRSDGSAGMCVRSAESWKHLVSHQPSCCSRFMRNR